jgi:amino-acid N-acetyltransferase
VSAEPIYSRPSRVAAAEILDSVRLPASDLTDAHMEHFFYCGPEAAPTGIVGLEVCGSHALLRSLAVASEYRGSGLGTQLVEHAERYARGLGIRSIFLLTMTAEEFFKRRGYSVTDRSNAPAEIRATRQFADLCPSSSAFLSKRITP